MRIPISQVLRMAVDALHASGFYVRRVADNRCRPAIVPPLPIITARQQCSERDVRVDVSGRREYVAILENIERLGGGGACIAGKGTPVEARLRAEASMAATEQFEDQGEALRNSGSS